MIMYNIPRISPIIPKVKPNSFFLEELLKSNPVLFNKLKGVAEEEKLGLSENDKLIRQLGVANGERAKYIFEKANKLGSNEEKNNYINDLKKKKIISDEVFSQLKELSKKN